MEIVKTFEDAVKTEIARLDAEADKIVDSKVVHDDVANFLADVVSLLERLVKGPSEPVAGQPPPPANV